MKNLGKKLAAAVVAAGMVLSTCLVASAATSSKTYDITINDDSLVFTRNGKKSTYSMKNSNVKLIIDEDDDLLVCYTDTKGKYKGISLGSQRTVNIGGEMNSLTLHSSLGSGFSLTVNDTGDIKTMTVGNKGDVTIQGDVTTLTVTAAASVSAEGATISQAKITNSSARLDADSDSNVKRVSTVNKSNVTGSGIGTKTSTRDDDDDDDDDDNGSRTRPVTLYCSSITIDADDYYNDDIRLSDIEEELEDNVEAYGEDSDGDEIDLKGKARWVNDSKKIFDEDNPKSGEFRVEYKFTPDKSDYKIVTDYVTVYVRY